MRLLPFLYLLTSCLTLTAEEIPSVEDAIPSTVKALPAPTAEVFPGGVRMAVTAASEEAQAEVNQGLNHLHGGWEFEASRHFAAAMREDPECLLAHWGMVMALLAPSPETGAARNAAAARLLDLVEKGKGTELERGYAYGLIKYIQDGPAGAASAFKKVAAKFPNEMQAAIFQALFSRTGYDEFGNALPDQEKAEEILLALIQKYPDSPLPLNALLTIRAEGPDLSGSLELARKLQQMAPQYAPYYHLLGHYEWRCGQHGRAASAFGRASTLYANWMQASKATLADCPEWVRSESYRIVAMASKGDFDNATAAAANLAATPFPPGRPSSSGARTLLWEGKTMPARILMRQPGENHIARAIASLPKPEETKSYRETSLAYWWIDGLRIALDAQSLMNEGKLEAARESSAVLTQHGEKMATMQTAANALGERSAWNRAFHALEVIASELRGNMVLAGPKDGRPAAFNWFRSAADHQRPATMMFPPMILTPMAIRLGDFQLQQNKPAEAIAAYEEALARFPNDMDALLGLKKAYEKNGDAEKAAATDLTIKTLREN